MDQNYLVLYRKYRPARFEEIVGQESIVRSIQAAIRLGKIAHAYLFSGPRGVGKTTMARLLARSVNCASDAPPCNACPTCTDFLAGRALDLIEIDAASNRGIDEIRELRDAIRFLPAQARYKVYIIDEVHMLTKEAFNALLKTLEEPPEHAILILATTELDRVPATIVSRTQHYDFRRPNLITISARLQEIARKEDKELEENGARLIASAAEGSMRDAESILGQIITIADQAITRADVESILGLPRREAALAMFSHIARKDTSAAFALVQDLHDTGYDALQFSKLLVQYLRSALLLKLNPAFQKFVAQELLPEEHQAIAATLPFFQQQELSRALAIATDALPRFRRSPIPQLPLELMILELIASEQGSNGSN